MHNCLRILGFTIIYLLLINNLHSQKLTKDTILIDTIKNDSINIDPIKDKKGKVLKANVYYESSDQYHEIRNKKSFLVSDAKVKYTDVEIQADYIEIDWEKGQVFANASLDSLGNVITPTVFKQGDRTFTQESFRFNFNTKEGVALNVRIKEGDGFVTGEQVKRKNDSVSLAKGLEYTTDELYKSNKEDRPDYVLRTGEAKILDRKEKGKTIITGPIQLRIHDVPTPLVAPFALIPLSDKRKAGILIPSFGEREQQGFFLQRGGLYVPFGEYLDLTLTADFFTRGSWGVHAISDYKKRYNFKGNLRFDYEKNINGIKGLSSFSEQKLYRFNWSHSQDPKANPNLSFSSSVNISSAEFFRNSINNINLLNGSNVTNTTSSSISLVKRFENSPFTASLNVTHSQNNTSTVDNITMTLPQLSVNMKRQYPFAKKGKSKKGLLQNISTDYNMNLRNSLVTNDDDFLSSSMFNNLNTGLRHNINLQTGTTIFNYFPLTFNVAYQDVWVLETLRQSFDTGTSTVLDETVNGFDSFRTFSTGLNLETNLYGQLNFKKNKDGDFPSIIAIRHVVRPRVGFSFQPDFSEDFWGYFDSYRDGVGNEIQYNRFAGGIFGAPSSGLQGNVNFGLSNNLEMKVRSKNSDSLEYQKIKIFEYLNVNGSYNVAADSLNFSTISLTGATSLFKDKFRVNYTANLDPYELFFQNPTDQTGIRVDNFGAFRLTNYNVNFSYGFNNKIFTTRKDKGEQEPEKQTYQRRGKGIYEVFGFDNDGYAKFDVPWNLSFDFNYNYNVGNSRESIVTSSLGIRGDVKVSPNWSVSGSTSYDIENKEFTFTRFNFKRDLRSFNINFSWVPTGPSRTWDFFIGIRSEVLRDALKYEERDFSGGTTFN